MSLKAKFLALFSGNGGTPPPDEAVDGFLTELAAVAKKEGETTVTPTSTATPTPIPTPTPVASFADSPEAKAMMAEINNLKRDHQLKDIQAAAAAAAAEEIRATRVQPKGKPNLVALFTQMALDDLDHASVVTFSFNEEVKTGSRVDALRAFLASLPTHNLYMNLVSDIPEGSAIFAAKGGLHEHKSEAERFRAGVDACLASIPEGQDILKARRSANGTK